MVPRKLFKIGEVMRYTGLSRQTVHNYTVMGLIAEAERTASGHRLYGEDVFERLARIRALQEFMTLQEIKAHLEHEDRVEAAAEGSVLLGLDAARHGGQGGQGAEGTEGAQTRRAQDGRDA